MTTKGPTEATARGLRRVALDQQRSGRVPGIAAAVVRDRAPWWHDGVGTAHLDRPGQAPGPDTQFQVASISKSFTAVLTMALRDEGRLSLDDTVETHLPESSHRGITVRQLLAHVSGMQREPVGDIWETLDMPDRQTLLSGWNDAERIGRPHHVWHYSNLCYGILGEIVTRLDGRSWEESLQTRILDPLEMRATTPGVTSSDAAGAYYVPPHTDVPVTEPFLDFAAMNPVGGLASTVSDLATWCGFWLDPVAEVLSPDTVEEMLVPQMTADAAGWRAGYGLGLQLVRMGDEVYAGHTGGSPGAITAFFVHRPSSTGGIALQNSTSAPDPAGLAIKLIRHAAEHDPVEPEPWTPGTVVPEELRDLIGIWYSEGHPFVFSIGDGKLRARAQDAPDRIEPSVFEPLEADLFRTSSSREKGELLRVTRDAAGRPVKLNWATYLCTREPLAFSQLEN